MPAVTVVLPTRDRPALLARALQSLAAQTWRDFEVIVVDNNRAVPPVAGGSCEAGGARVKVVAARSATNAAQARNAGLEAAEGEWVTFLDDDDEYLSDKLARQLDLARASGAPLVLCGYEVELGLRRRVIQAGSGEFVEDGLLLDAVWGTPFMFLRRVGAPRFPADLDAAEDLVFAHAAVRGFGLRRVPCVPRSLVRVHLQPPSARVNANHEALWRAQQQVLEKFGTTYSEAARRRFRLRAELQRAKGNRPWREVLACARRLVADGGLAELRRAGNAVAYRSPWLRPHVVS